MEQAADAGDRAAVEEGFAQFMAQYDGVAAAIRRLVPQSGAQPLVDDEIMEFFPE